MALPPTQDTASGGKRNCLSRTLTRVQLPGRNDGPRRPNVDLDVRTLAMVPIVVEGQLVFAGIAAKAGYESALIHDYKYSHFCLYVNRTNKQKCIVFEARK